MITNGMKYKLNGIHRDITNKMDSLKRKKAMGYNIDREVKRLEKFALDNGAEKDWRYNSDNLRDVDKLMWSAYDRLCMDISNTKFENPEHWKRIDRMKEVFTTDSKERIEPTSVDDARELIRRTNDPDTVMNIIDTQGDRNDRLTLMQENWDKIGAKFQK